MHNAPTANVAIEMLRNGALLGEHRRNHQSLVYEVH